MDKKVFEKIIMKKEFSNLPKKDVEKVYNLFDTPRGTSKEYLLEEEKIKKTRDMLRKVYFAFGSLKLLNPKIIDKKDVDEILKKHISTKERFEFYNELYKKLLSDFKGSVIDLGAGINGLSYRYFPKETDYIGVEAVGQLVDLMNAYFEKNKLNSKAIHESLFDLKKIGEIIKKTKKPRVVFLFKTLDSLEMIERDYSKKLLKEIVPLVGRVVVSFATQSLISKKRFKVKRYWFENFVKENFEILGDFELNGERYIVFKK
jgi:hypothetical protein